MIGPCIVRATAAYVGLTALDAYRKGRIRAQKVSRDGRKALYNSIEGTTRLWDVGSSGEVEGTFESFAKSDDAQSGPCKSDFALTT